ncbi:MauE/DoxX family redox-associated membrane protein [Parapedobacter tibetensis]|uniref:MauE/DoxX family redox-associated membrane protein n=1 Tax=Parapedobacter tibetensis TaxID=2972951 RepID=UPI00356B6916
MLTFNRENVNRLTLVGPPMGYFCDMSITRKHIASPLVASVRLTLLLLWVPVAVEKLWGLQGFYSTLLRQPFPDWWADVLFWLLPLLELLAGVLIAWPNLPSSQANLFVTASKSPRYRGGAKQPTFGRKLLSLIPIPESLHRLGLWLSAILMLSFTLFILFGVLGWYAKKPCGCGSIVSGLSWNEHLWFNLGFLLLSILGIWLTRPQRKPSADSHSSSSLRTRALDKGSGVKQSNVYEIKRRIRFPRKFALFRRRA